MELRASDIKHVKGDTILVRMVLPPEKKGSLYLPESARQIDRKHAWQGVVVQFGDEVDYEQWAPHQVAVGDTVVLGTECLNCRGFCERNGHGEVFYKFVKDDDVIGKVVEPEAVNA